MKKQRCYMIMDLQYGSTGKGLLAGYLAVREQPDVVITAWAPNAGHTYIDKNGRKYIHRMLANGVVSPSLKRILIGPGSAIDLAVLYAEMASCADHLAGVDIIIHPHAAIVSSDHVFLEQRNVKIGSTMKGTGAAYIQRIERDPDNTNVAKFDIPSDFFNKVIENIPGCNVYVSSELYNEAIDQARVIQIEGAQGYSLSMYHGFYPYTTSRDVTPAQVMADCAIPYYMTPDVYGTLRTYPIRVSNRVTDEGTFSSGGCYPDQHEIDWSELGMEPELTTVTKLPRRIFTFSNTQFQEAFRQCAPVKLFLNFANYLDEQYLIDMIDEIELSGGNVCWIGVGATDGDVIETNYAWMDDIQGRLK